MTVTAAALLATACGSPSSTRSGGSANAGGSANYVAAVAYSRCVRSHGIPGFPDPDSSGQISKQAIRQLGVSDSVLKAATTGTCANLNPYNPPPPAQQRQELADDLKFSQCMRSHGLPGFPDPTNSNGRVEFVLSVSKNGFDPHSPQVLAKAHECQHVLPAGSRLPSVTETS
jgi:hypothetical protein